MKAPAWFNRSSILFGILTLVLVYALKFHYSHASASRLGWILWPTSRVVQIITGISFESGPNGFVSWEHGATIAKSCAGVNFLIIALCMSIFIKIQDRHALLKQAAVLLQSLAAAYGLTILVNSTRIILGMTLLNADIYSGFITRTRVHRWEGIFVYFTGLWIFYLLLKRKRVKKTDEHSRSWTPLFWYFSITLLVPLLNRSLLFRSAETQEHVLYVLAIPFIIFIGSLIIRTIFRITVASCQLMLKNPVLRMNKNMSNFAGNKI